MDPSAAATTATSSSSSKPVSEGGDNGAGADSAAAAVDGQETKAKAKGDDASPKGADKKGTPAAAGEVTSTKDKEVGEGWIHVGFVVRPLCPGRSLTGCVL